MAPTIDMNADFSDAVSEDSISLAPLGSPPPLPTPSLVSGDHPVSDVVAPPPTISRSTRSPTRSPAWDHFRKADDFETSRRALCMYCDRTFVVNNGSTSTLLNHLKAKHPGRLAASSSDG
jgi:BED zinc finger